MSFVYPRTITITRPPVRTSGQVGPIEYQVLDPSQETLIASNVPASIQRVRTNLRLAANLPSDIIRGSDWSIFIPNRGLARGIMKDNDIITDDEGIRYQVSSAYWNSLGYNATCERLQN